MKFELMNNYNQSAVIKVIGVGGTACDFVKNKVSGFVQGVECVFTDDLLEQKEPSKYATLDEQKRFEIGKQHALEDRESIIEEGMEGADMAIIVVASDGYGVGAAGVIAEVAKSMGLLTIIVTENISGTINSIPEIIPDMDQTADTTIRIQPEQIVGKSIEPSGHWSQYFQEVMLRVIGYTHLITQPGLIRVDFADVRTVLENMGLAVVGLGSAKGDDRATEAAKQALHHLPLTRLELDYDPYLGVLVTVTGDANLTMGEFSEVGDLVREWVSEEANVVVGTAIDDSLDNEIQVTLIITGLNNVYDYPVIRGDMKHLDYLNLDISTFLRTQSKLEE